MKLSKQQEIELQKVIDDPQYSIIPQWRSAYEREFIVLFKGNMIASETNFNEALLECMIHQSDRVLATIKK